MLPHGMDKEKQIARDNVKSLNTLQGSGNTFVNVTDSEVKEEKIPLSNKVFESKFKDDFFSS